MRKRLFLTALALGTAAFAAGRADLAGTWQLDPSRSDSGEEKLKGETLDIKQMEDAVQVADALIEADGKERKSDVQCNTLGKECKLRGEQVTVYYNGNALVIMETLPKDVVVKRRLEATDDGRTLNMRLTRLAPSGEKIENYTFTRQPASTAKR